jgi:hypothetical protein
VWRGNEAARRGGGAARAARVHVILYCTQGALHVRATRQRRRVGRASSLRCASPRAALRAALRIGAGAAARQRAGAPRRAAYPSVPKPRHRTRVSHQSPHAAAHPLFPPLPSRSDARRPRPPRARGAERAVGQRCVQDDVPELSGGGPVGR